MIFSLPPVRAQTNQKTVVVSAFRDAMSLPPLRPHLDYGDPRNPLARIHVGSSEMPTDVSTGLPSARDTTRVYATRLDGQIEAIDSAWHEWLKQKIAQGIALTDDQVKFDVDWPAFYSDWKRFYIQISSFSILGPSPAEAWSKIQNYDDQAEALRQRFASFTAGTTVVAPGPQTDLGNQPSVIKDVGATLTSFGKALLIGGAVVAGVVLYQNRPRSVTSG